MITWIQFEFEFQEQMFTFQKDLVKSITWCSYMNCSIALNVWKVSVYINVEWIWWMYFGRISFERKTKIPRKKLKEWHLKHVITFEIIAIDLVNVRTTSDFRDANYSNPFIAIKTNVCASVLRYILVSASDFHRASAKHLPSLENLYHHCLWFVAF